MQEELSSIAPTIIEADVRAAALAEALFGAGKPFRNFLYVTVGTGISCCLMLDGAPYLGAHGAIGHDGEQSARVPCEQCGQVESAEPSKRSPRDPRWRRAFALPAEVQRARRGARGCRRWQCLRPDRLSNQRAKRSAHRQACW